MGNFCTQQVNNIPPRNSVPPVKPSKPTHRRYRSYQDQLIPSFEKTLNTVA